MTPTVPESKILNALLERMRAFVTVLPIQWPGETLDSAPEDRKFIEVIWLPNDTARVVIGSSGPHRYYGIFQPTVHWPIGKGELEPCDVAGQVAAHFSADLKMVFDGVVVRSMKQPTVERAVKEGPDLLVAVTVEYECYI